MLSPLDLLRPSPDMHVHVMRWRSPQDLLISASRVLGEPKPHGVDDPMQIPKGSAPNSRCSIACLGAAENRLQHSRYSMSIDRTIGSIQASAHVRREKGCEHRCQGPEGKRSQAISVPLSPRVTWADHLAAASGESALNTSTPAHTTV